MSDLLNTIQRECLDAFRVHGRPMMQPLDEYRQRPYALRTIEALVNKGFLRVVRPANTLTKDGAKLEATWECTGKSYP